jgi:NAD(P)H-quinone oxidoreductase subunit 5
MTSDPTLFTTAAALRPPLAAGAALSPPLLMLVAAARALASPHASAPRLWRSLARLSTAALAGAALSLACALARGAAPAPLLPGLAVQPLGAWIALLVQFLGVVIGAYASRYLAGEPKQRARIAALASVLACVQLMLLADHWLVLIAAWSGVGAALHSLLCFYPDRPFALLAAHKKRIADRLADLLLLVAAALAWRQVGSGSLSALSASLAHGPAPLALQGSAVLLVLAVGLRTALLPVHGWLTQVMEAPTPVSALLHAGVVNLGGYVLIRFAPLLQATPAARALLVAMGLSTALLAGMVSLTRVSIKVRLAWSTVAQMGFMVLECGLGLYQLAALHLLGHSLYKAHAFLSASGAVRDTRLRALRGAAAPTAASVVAAPWIAVAVLLLVQHALHWVHWPWWWLGMLALAWAPLLWVSTRAASAEQPPRWQALAGLAWVAGLGLAAQGLHRLSLGVVDLPWSSGGAIALAGMTLLYLGLAALQGHAQALEAWRRWSYAGFYVDEIYTRVALKLWPAHWGGQDPASTPAMHGTGSP